MFYTGDAYNSDTSLDWTKAGGRRIPMAIKSAMHLKFYLYGAHSFSSSNTLKTEW